MAVLINELLRHEGTLVRCIHSIMDAKFRHYGLLRGQFIFLTRICEEPGLTLAVLTARCKVDKATTTKAVAKLVRAGLAEKRADLRDKRSWHVFPTERAKGLYEKLIDEENRQIGVCLAGLTEEERQTALRLACLMSRNAEAEWDKWKDQGRNSESAET